MNSYRHLHLRANVALLVAVLAVSPPVIVTVNAIEFALVARLAGHRVSRREAVLVSLAGSLANLLPIPGSVVLRSTALVSAGLPVGTTLRAVAKVGGAWVAVTAMAFGLAGAGRNPAAGGVVAASGGALLVLCLLLIWRQAAGRCDRRLGLLGAVVGIEVCTVGCDAGRLLVVLHAIGFNAGVLDALALTSANVLTTAIGILPSGLGLREVLSAVFGAASGLPSAVAVTATVADRLLVMVGLAGLGVLVAAWKRRPGSPPPIVGSTAP